MGPNAVLVLLSSGIAISGDLTLSDGAVLNILGGANLIIEGSIVYFTVLVY